MKRILALVVLLASACAAWAIVESVIATASSYAPQEMIGQPTEWLAARESAKIQALDAATNYLQTSHIWIVSMETSPSKGEFSPGDKVTVKLVISTRSPLYRPNYKPDNKL